MDSYRLLDFPDDDNFWLVSCTRNVYYNQYDYRIEIELVAIDNDLHQQKPMAIGNVIRVSGNTQDEKLKKIKRRVPKIGVDLLAYCEIGSVWYKRQKISSLVDFGKNIFTIQINDPQKGQLSTISKVTDIANQYHPFSQTSLQSSCLVFSSGDFKVLQKEEKEYSKVIFLPAEIIRFYYSGSGYLLKQIFGGGVVNGGLYDMDSVRYDRKTKEGYINLTKNLFKNS